MKPEPRGENLTECQNCATVRPERELDEIEDLLARLAAGDSVPVGQMPRLWSALPARKGGKMSTNPVNRCGYLMPTSPVGDMLTLEVFYDLASTLARDVATSRVSDDAFTDGIDRMTKLREWDGRISGPPRNNQLEGSEKRLRQPCRRILCREAETAHPVSTPLSRPTGCLSRYRSMKLMFELTGGTFSDTVSVSPLDAVKALIEEHGNDLAFVVNISGGNDSLRMLGMLKESFPLQKMYVVMADTGFEHVKRVPAVEWATRQAQAFGEKLYVVRNPNKTYLEMVERRETGPHNRRILRTA
jgi:hypothetical protein